MADNINTRLAGLINNCQTLKKKIDANALAATTSEPSASQLAEAIETQADQLKSEFDKILDAAKDTREKIDKNKTSEIAGKFKPIDDWLSEGQEVSVAIAAPPSSPSSPPPSKPPAEAEGDEIGLKDFLSNVSTSLIDAQKALNRQSLDYAARLDPQIPPTHYAIPSLKAEMRVGFRETGEKRIGLILFSNKTQRENYGESVVTFELAAVPPPAARPVNILPLTRVIAVGEERERILDWLAEQRTSEGSSQNLFETTTYKNMRDNALALRFFDDEEGDYRYLILWPSQQRNARKEYWRELAVISLKPRGEGFEFDLSIFDDSYPRKDFLRIPADTELKKLSQDDLVGLILHLGDVLMTNVLIINDWMGKNGPES